MADRFYITTPNRWFPVELHTFLPLLHWLPQHWHQAILRRLGKAFWADTANLNLVSARELRACFLLAPRYASTGTARSAGRRT